jgi:succinate dehydrogenase / fumarate reductase flavoprotein subunit
MHGSNRLGGNSLSDLLVFGRRAGLHAAEYAEAADGNRPLVDQEQIDAAAEEALAPFAAEGGENPYGLHQELQQSMNDLVGIIRREGEMEEALHRLSALRERAEQAGVEGHRQFNPGWHLALDLRNMLLVSECVARAALERQESRGGHTREDHPAMAAEWRRVLLACALADKPVPGEGAITLQRKPNPPIREDLLALFGADELKKYLTEDEMPDAEAGLPPQRADADADKKSENGAEH